MGVSTGRCSVEKRREREYNSPWLALVQAMAECIFQVFQHLNRAEDYAGTGMGLALVRKAMQRMGGHVWAETAPAQGATFYLKCRKNKNLEYPVCPNLEVSMISTINPILLVEDNPMDVDLTKRAFARHRVTNPVVVARDGEEALAYLSRWEAGEPLPVVILLDLHLPKVDGLQVLSQIKSHPRFRTIPVVVLSTSSEEGDMRTAYQLGANSYVVKSADVDKFMQAVEQIEMYWCVLNTMPR